MPSSAPFLIEHAARTDVGMRRAVNQDSVTATCGGGASRSEHFFMVADGMGAHAAGELASKIAVDTTPIAYFKSKQSAPAALRHAVREANKRIHCKGSSDAEFRGMGTTCSCLVLSRWGALVAHVGDSRVYRLRDSHFEQLTFDHSLVWEMAHAIDASESDVPAYVPKNVITRSLGPHDSVKVDLEGPLDIRQGDLYLLCSDGLCGVLSDPLIGAILAAMPIDSAAQTLVDLANLHGGPDNISAIVARVAQHPDSAAAQTGGAPRARSLGVHLLGGGVALACLAAFAWFFSVNNALGMLLTAAGCGASLAYLLHGDTDSPRDTFHDVGGPYGNGPYRACDCQEPREAADALHQLVAELSSIRDQAETDPEGTGAINPSLRIDWGTYEQRKQQADARWRDGQFSQAVRAYSDLVRDVMREARNGQDTPC